ncbi:MAG: lipopolysaccharide biosynthesis protein [Bacteroidota bacterium]|nr:lipopolysaccharide biosynthesis protein [Bacteroidota bacterium]
MEEKEDIEVVGKDIRDSNHEAAVETQDQGLKQVISILKELFSIVRTYALLFVIPIILTGLYGFYKGKQVKPTYTAKITFFLSEERPQIAGGGSFANLLQTTNANFGNPKKLKEYAFTEKVGSKMVFKKYVYRGKEDYLANHYLRLMAGYKDSYFKDFTTVKEMSIPDYLVFKGILSGIRGMVTIDYNEAEIYSISITSGDEEFSKLLCECFYENLIDYYIERATRKAKITVDFLEEKLAYVKAQLENSEFNLADYKDKANNLVTFKADLNETRYIRNKALLEGLYAQTATGLEASKTNLQSIMPLFQTIDEPHLPLQRNVVSTRNQTLMYTFLGGIVDILIVVFIFFRRHYWKSLKALFN